MTSHTDQNDQRTMGARPVITLIWTPLGWMADMSHAHGWEGIQSLFGTLMLPTAFTGSAAESMVLASVGALHPDHAVTVRVSSLYDSGREGSAGSVVYGDSARSPNGPRYGVRRGSRQ